MTPNDVSKLIKEKSIEVIDIKFTDLFGPVSYTHLTLPTSDLV